MSSQDSPVTNSNSASTGSNRNLIVFLVVQAIVLGGGAIWAGTRLISLETEKQWPEFREKPLVVRPTYDLPQIVSDEQLQTVLHKLRPRLKDSKPIINHVDHALRMWGLDAKFNDPKCLSGLQLRNILLNHDQFKKAWGEKTPALLIDTPHGVKVRLQEGTHSMSHADHTLAVQAEIGTSLDHMVKTPAGETSLKALLDESLHDFSLNQVEYEWSVLTYLLFLGPEGPGRTGEGQRVTFGDMADRLMRQRLPEGVCFGNHRLFTLVIMLRLDDDFKHQVLTPEKRAEIIDFLKAQTNTLVKTQQPDGYWDENWAGSEGTSEVRGTTSVLTNRILATGHALEWWAMAPEELHPPRETLVRAGQWLCRTIEELPDDKIRSNYTFLSHAGRALALWRGRLPAEVYVAPPEETKPDVTAEPKAELKPEPTSENKPEPTPASKSSPSTAASSQ